MIHNFIKYKKLKATFKKKKRENPILDFPPNYKAYVMI